MILIEEYDSSEFEFIWDFGMAIILRCFQISDIFFNKMISTYLIKKAK